MKRTKEWWARLTKEERIRLVFLERADKHGSGSSAYLPEGYGDCPACSTPSRYGLCTGCLNDLIGLINKANKEE
ncbi:MAG TPA: hypothetical protein VMW42_01590 [Desulfatiglandales bacterium]|nr:hypothetical protein [Desulfatiglandales bacterium]